MFLQLLVSLNLQYFPNNCYFEHSVLGPSDTVVVAAGIFHRRSDRTFADHVVGASAAAAAVAEKSKCNKQ